jgi:hypothetical protein
VQSRLHADQRLGFAASYGVRMPPATSARAIGTAWATSFRDDRN